MSCEELWKRVRELGGESAKAHQAYLALVGPPQFMKVLSVTLDESQAIEEARQKCNRADEALSRAIKAAIRAQH